MIDMLMTYRSILLLRTTQSARTILCVTGSRPSSYSFIISSAKFAKCESDDQKAGVGLLRRSLEAPVHQIAQNAGKDGSLVV